MKGLRVLVCLLFVISSALVILPSIFSQEEAEVATKEASGKIVSIDLEKSSLVIKQLKDEARQAYEDIIIYADESTLIEKNSATVNLSDLEVGKDLTVEYVTNEAGENIASYIWVN